MVLDIRHLSCYMRVGLTEFCCIMFPVVCCEILKTFTFVVLSGRESCSFSLNSNKRITPIGVRNNVDCPILTFTSSLNSSTPEHSTITCHGLDRFVAFRPTSRYNLFLWSHEAVQNFEVFTTDLNAVWMCVRSSYCSNSFVTYVKWPMEVKSSCSTFFLPILHVIS